MQRIKTNNQSWQFNKAQKKWIMIDIMIIVPLVIISLKSKLEALYLARIWNIIQENEKDWTDSTEL